jgi:predicted O-methyltransferase YrrM
MSTTAIDQNLATPAGAGRVARKIWREVSRPFRHRARPVPAVEVAAIATPTEEPAPYLTGAGVGIAGFHPLQATIEPEAIPFVTQLVRESRKYPGPIIEIGTLLGVTTTNMALAKAPDQKIITVDVYCWNPWGLPPDAHAALASQVLYYLAQTGDVEIVRMDKNEFFRTYKGPSPSMVFLDAWHDYDETKKDIQWAKRVGAKIIAGHDYCDEFAGVKQIVDEYGGPRESSGTVWVL